MRATWGWNKDGNGGLASRPGSDVTQPELSTGRDDEDGRPSRVSTPVRLLLEPFECPSFPPCRSPKERRDVLQRCVFEPVQDRRSAHAFPLTALFLEHGPRDEPSVYDTQQTHRGLHRHNPTVHDVQAPPIVFLAGYTPFRLRTGVGPFTGSGQRGTRRSTGRRVSASGS